MKNTLLISLLFGSTLFAQDTSERETRIGVALREDASFNQKLGVAVAEMQSRLVALQLERQHLLDQFGEGHPQLKAVTNQIKAMQVMTRRMQAASIEARRNRVKSLLDALASELSKRIEFKDQSQRKAVENAIAVIRDAIQGQSEEGKQLNVTAEEHRRLAEMQQALRLTRERLLKDQQRLEEEMLRLRSFEASAKKRIDQEAARLNNQQAKSDLTTALARRVDSIESSLDEMKGMLKQLMSAKTSDEKADETE